MNGGRRSEEKYKFKVKTSAHLLRMPAFEASSRKCRGAVVMRLLELKNRGGGQQKAERLDLVEAAASPTKSGSCRAELRHPIAMTADIRPQLLPTAATWADKIRN